MKRHDILALLFLTTLVSICGCAKIAEWLNRSSTDAVETPTVSTEGALPVTRRLCAVVQIGNLDQFNADAISDENSAKKDAKDGAKTGNASKNADLDSDVDGSAATPKATPKADGEGSLSDILNDPNLSEEEKDAKIQLMINQSKEQLGKPNAPSTRKGAPVEEEPSLDTMEKLVPSSAMATTEEDELLLDIPVENVPQAASSTQSTDANGSTAKTSANAGIPSDTKATGDMEIDALMNDTIMNALEEAEASSAKAKPAKEAASEDVTPSIDAMLAPKSDLPNPADLPTEKSDIGADELGSLGIADIEAFCTEQAKEFLRINQNVPKEVQDEIKAAHFQNYSVWLGQSGSNDFYAVRYLEYTGSNFELDYLTLIRSPNYRKWLQSQSKYLRPTGGFDSRDGWLEMSEVWHCN